MFPKKAAFKLLTLAILTTAVSCARQSPRFTPASLTASERACYDAINTAHAQEEAAIARKDIDGAMAECSPDYVGVAPGGRTANYAQVRQSLLTEFATESQGIETNKIEGLQLAGDVVVVEVKCHVEATLPIPNPLTGRPLTRAEDHRDRETWVKGAQGWRCTKSEILSSS